MCMYWLGVETSAVGESWLSVHVYWLGVKTSAVGESWLSVYVLARSGDLCSW